MIKCGHCKGRHETVKQVSQCAKPTNFLIAEIEELLKPNLWEARHSCEEYDGECCNGAGGPSENVTPIEATLLEFQQANGELHGGL